MAENMNRCICADNKSIPESMVLGNLLFYSVDDILITDSNLRNVFMNNGVPTSYIGQIHPSDVFRRATSSFKNTRTSEGRIEVDEVVCNEDGIKRFFGIKEINSGAEDIKYTPVFCAEYNRQSESISTYYLQGVSGNPEFDVMQQDIHSKYTEWTQYHTKDTVRNLFNKIINSTHPVTLVPGGLCKFIPKVHSQLLYSLKEALEGLDAWSVTQNNHGSYMEIIPVINTEEQQKLIKVASETEIKANLSSFISEIREAVKTKGSLTPRTVKSYMARFKSMQEQIDDYEALLGNYMEVLKHGVASAINNMQKEDYSSI